MTDVRLCFDVGGPISNSGFLPRRINGWTEAKSKPRVIRGMNFLLP